MSSKPITIFMSAAEASGDQHAANLIRAIARRIPSARFIGVGGPKMAAAGCELLADLTIKAAMLGGPILRLGYWIRLMSRIKRTMRKLQPDLHIPVDSPALNWHLAKTAKSIGTPVLYYIAPQVWAWAPWRVRKVARLTDKVACILPFEERYFRDRGVDATYVGHPLFDTLEPIEGQLPDLAEAWSEGTWNVALLPGSRGAEISGHIPALLDVAEAIKRRWSRAVCTITAHNDVGAKNIYAACKGRLPSHVEVVVGKTRHVLRNAHIAVAVSGTVTLEVAHFGVPMVIFYRVNALGHKVVGPFLGISTPHLALVNILAGKRIVPELMPWYGRIKPVREMVLDVMKDLGCLYDMREAMREVTSPLRSTPSASDNAADLVMEMLNL
ncbi:MAG: lipid-A-disaccharide synthase [bacterium]|nr:lipid-A-disaccharide synthase [bacterium]